MGYVPAWVVDQVAERADVSRQYVVAEIERGAFPGARKLNLSASNSPWLIPVRDFHAWMKKRGQPVKD